MSLNKLKQANGKWVVYGTPLDCWVGIDGFKLCNMLSKYFFGLDGQKWLVLAERWVEHCQQLLGEHTIIRVFAETGGWSGHPMFGAEPRDAGIWNLGDLRKRSEIDPDTGKPRRRIKELTAINEAVIDWLMRTSHETGVAFEYVVDATLKHTMGSGKTPEDKWLNTSITDHAIRQTATYMRDLYREKYPNAMIIVEARNEWTAHNKQRTTAKQVRDWAERWSRWEKGEGDDKRLMLRHAEPQGDGWTCRQWPEGYLIVDPTLGKDIGVGPEPGKYKMSLDHPRRDRPNGDDPTDWWTLPPDYHQLVDEARGVPYGYNESILYGDKRDKSRLREWYGARGWTTDIDHYLEWIETCRRNVGYLILHTEKGMQTDVTWPRPLTVLEEALGGITPQPVPTPPTPSPPGPTPPTPSPRPVTYQRVIDLAYREILRRASGGADPGGLAHYDAKMRGGMTEATMRERLLRSVEFANKNRL